MPIKRIRTFGPYSATFVARQGTKERYRLDDIQSSYCVIQPENDVWRWAAWDDYTSYGGHRATAADAEKAVAEACKHLERKNLRPQRSLCMGALPGRKRKAIWLERPAESLSQIEPLAYFVSDEAYRSFKVMLGGRGLVAQLSDNVERID